MTHRYSPLPPSWLLSPEWEGVALGTLAGVTATLGAISLAQSRAWRRRRERAWPGQLQLLDEPAPTLPGLGVAVALLTLFAVILQAWLLHRAGAWQLSLVAAWSAAMVNHRRPAAPTGSAATLLATAALLGMILASTQELLPPDGSRPLSHQGVLLLSGFATLLIGLMWSWTARRWSLQRTALGPISTGGRMALVAVSQAVLCLGLSAWWMARGFRLT